VVRIVIMASRHPRTVGPKYQALEDHLIVKKAGTGPAAFDLSF